MSAGRWFAVVALAWLAIASASAGDVAPPTVFPDMDSKATQNLLLVGTLAPGGYLPQFEECGDSRALCRDPEPFWLKVEVLTRVAGPAVPSRLAAASTSHYGMPGVSRSPARYLLGLMTDGKSYILRRYGFELIRVDGGQDFIPWYGHSPHWLPCGIGELAVVRPALTKRGEGARPRYKGETPDPELFDVRGEREVPRRWIPVASLGSYMARLPAGDARICLPRSE